MKIFAAQFPQPVFIIWVSLGFGAEGLMAAMSRVALCVLNESWSNTVSGKTSKVTNVIQMFGI